MVACEAVHYSAVQNGRGLDPELPLMDGFCPRRTRAYFDASPVYSRIALNALLR